MEMRRIVIEMDDEDYAALEKAKELFRTKHGVVSFALVIRTIVREYVAAKEQEKSNG
jgi:metal-responsive CopG/Arc/MetJ family transcriptional regulator